MMCVSYDCFCYFDVTVSLCLFVVSSPTPWVLTPWSPCPDHATKCRQVDRIRGHAWNQPRGYTALPTTANNKVLTRLLLTP